MDRNRSPDGTFNPIILSIKNSWSIHLFIILAGLLIPFPMRAQNVISGFVSDSANGETLIGVNITIQGSDYGTVTNPDGYYVLNEIPAGQYTLVFSYIGYDVETRSVSLNDSAERVLNVSLEPTVIEGTGVVIESKFREDKELVETGSIRVSPGILEFASVLAESDLMRTLQLLPGVLTSSEFSSGLFIRGGTPDQNLILLDGTEIYNASHLFGIFSTFDTEAIKEVRLIRGGFPAKYGGRLSSVLDIRNMDGNRKEFEGNASLGLVSAKTSLQGPIFNGSWFFSGRRTFIDRVVNAAKHNTTGAINERLSVIPDYYFYDTHFKINQNLGHNNRVSLTLYQGKDALNFDVEPFVFDFNWGNSTLSTKWTHLFSNRIISKFYITASRYHTDLNRDDALFTGMIGNSLRNFSIKSDVEYFASNRHTEKIGLEYKYLQSRYNSRLNEQHSGIRSGGNLFNLYFQDEWNFMPRIDIQSGIRFNFYAAFSDMAMEDKSTPQYNSRIDISPRIGFKFYLNSNMNLTWSFGRYFQYVNILSLGLNEFSFMDVWIPGDNNIRPGEAFHYILGFEKIFPMKLRFEAEAYYKHMPQLLEFNQEARNIRGGNDLFHQGTGWAYGADFYLEKQRGRFNGWISYSLGWTRRKFSEINDGIPYFPKYDRRNSVKLVGMYSFHESWALNFAWTYGTGQAYTAPIGHYRLRWPEDTVPVVIGEEKNNSRLPAYHRLDAGIRYQSAIDNDKIFNQYIFFLQIFNVYNRRNVWFKNVDFKEDGVAKAYEIKMLPIFPSLGVEIYF